MEKNELLRCIPHTDEILREEALVFLSQGKPAAQLSEAVKKNIAAIREKILKEDDPGVSSREEIRAWILAAVQKELQEKKPVRLRKVINATGILLHTNLGRAPLSESAVQAVREAAEGYTDLEYDLRNGTRKERSEPAEALLCALTGAEAALVVNNNAAAVLLSLYTLARRKEVLVSRGELVEIGGSFRLPEIMEIGDTVLREVGTTNRTDLSDYERAFSPEKTGAILKVYPSNFKITGFTKEAELRELGELGKKLSVPVIYDMGSGLLCDLSPFGIPEKALSQKTLEEADVVCFSADKLLGGPQAGILLGKRSCLEEMKKVPLCRALRPDKLTMAALTATLSEYFGEKNALAKIPVLRMAAAGEEELIRKAEKFCRLLSETAPWFTVTVEKTENRLGGGTAPETVLPGAAAVISGPLRPEVLDRKLRRGNLPVLGRIHHQKFYLEMRTVPEEELLPLAEALRETGEVLYA